jgi:hypothetical protein
LKEALTAERVWERLEETRDPAAAAAPPSALGLFERIAIIEEAARHDPRLGYGLLGRAAAAPPPGPTERLLCHSSWLAGAADHVSEAGIQAARGRGAFASSLLGCRAVQESLASLVSRSELLRLGTYRICRLLDRGERDRADSESAWVQAQALALGRAVLDLARSLFGEAWATAHLPEDVFLIDRERKP